MDELLRLLDLVKREVGADDARAELGGRDHADEDKHLIWARMGQRWRVVAIFDSPIEDRETKKERLQTILAPFTSPDRIEHPGGAYDPAAPQRGTLEGVSIERSAIEVDEELDRLAERTGARAAVVFDERSPVLWGCSTPRADGWDVERMEVARSLAEATRELGLDPAAWLTDGTPSPSTLRNAAVDETQGQRLDHRFRRLSGLAPEWSQDDWEEALQVATGVSEARKKCEAGAAPERVAAHGESWGVFAKGFAQIYLLALIFDGPYSELHAEGLLVRALPLIESLVLKLPPVQPPPRGAKVIAFRRR